MHHAAQNYCSAADESIARAADAAADLLLCEEATEETSGLLKYSPLVVPECVRRLNQQAGAPEIDSMFS